MTNERQALVVRRFVVVGLIAPAILTGTALALQLSWRADLPDVVATHWGASGKPDGFGAASTFLILTAVIGFGLPALIAGSTLPMLARGSRGANFRAMGAISVALATWVSVLNAGAVWMQRGLADGHDSPTITPALLASVGASLAVGAAGWYFQPHQETVIAGLTHTEPIALGQEERAVWMRTTSMPRVFVLGLVGILIALGLGSGGLFATGNEAPAWIYLGTMALVLVLVAATSSFHVQVDRTGLTVVSALGLPRFFVPIADVVDAGVAPVNGFAEFGGWGIRQRPGALGVVMRNGMSLQVTRRSGRRFIVTVDDAATAAALLTGLAARSGAASLAQPDAETGA